MARPDVDVSNELFETLTQWDVLLRHRTPDGPVPPCP